MHINTLALSDEQKLIILLSRVSITELEGQELLVLAKKTSTDWFSVIRMSIKNKVLPLVWGNLKKFNVSHAVPLRLAQLMNFHMLGTRERNKLMLSELENISQQFEKENIPCIPLKGAFLIPNLYVDFGIRTVNDMDVLIRRNDAMKVRKIMNSLGYVEGEYDREKNEVKRVSREKSILWQTKMNNLLPFLKLQESEYAPVIQLDFSFSLDLELKSEPVEQMITNAVRGNRHFHYLQPADFFLHQCCHHYKEASNASWVLLNSDLNLIKFCDVREYVLKFMNAEQLREAVQKAEQFGIKEAVYFTLYYMKEIYNDGYEQELLNELNVENLQFLNSYGAKDYGQLYTWNKTFWERLFSDTNKDEIKDGLKYSSIVEFS